MRIRFWGTRGTRPTPGPRTLRYGGNTACVEVRTNSGELIILDSGSGICELGNSLNGAPLDATLLISHTHWDHIQGFPFFGPNFRAGSRLRVIGPKGSMKSLQSAFADQMDPAYFPLSMDQMPATLEFQEMAAGEVFEVGGVRVIPHALHHPIATFGYRLEEEGRTLVYATDNEPYEDPDVVAAQLLEDCGSEPPPDSLEALWQEGFVRWCSRADLLIHDAQYSRDEYRTHVGWGHSSVDYALLVAREAAVARLALFHHDPLHSDSQVDAMAEEAVERAYRDANPDVATFPAAEGQEIVL